jgi:hypothetical protein
MYLKAGILLACHLLQGKRKWTPENSAEAREVGKHGMWGMLYHFLVTRSVAV